MIKHSTPTKEQIALLPLFERLSTSQIALVSNVQEAMVASAELLQANAWGFDTESKPTFVRNEASDGPHIVQLALSHKAWVFQLHDIDCREQVGKLLSAPNIDKFGFGLRDDRKHILRKFGVEPVGLRELNAEFSQRGFRREVGVKDGIAALFGQRFIKSKKAATSNWASTHLSEAQLIYAANDAYAALKVAQALLA